MSQDTEKRQEMPEEKAGQEEKQTTVQQEEQPKPEEKAKPDKPEKKKKEKIDPLREELTALQTDYADLQDQFLRIRAEYDNFRKRSQAERAGTYNQAVSDTVAAILPVADNMERALAQENATAADMKKGLEMIQTQMTGIFEGMNIAALGEVGEAFDPNCHNAVSHVEDEALGENVISQVMQKGYRIGDKVIRHAMVQVAN